MFTSNFEAKQLDFINIMIPLKSKPNKKTQTNMCHSVGTKSSNYLSPWLEVTVILITRQRHTCISLYWMAKYAKNSYRTRKTPIHKMNPATVVMLGKNLLVA